MMNDSDQITSAAAAAATATNFSFCHLSRFFCCQSSSFDGSHRAAGHHHHHLLGCSSLLGKYRCQQHQQRHQHRNQQQQLLQNGGLFTSTKIIRNGTSSSSPARRQIDNFEAEEEGEEEAGGDNNNFTTTTTTFYQPRNLENSSTAAPYYYGDIVTTTSPSFSQSPAHNFQRSPHHYHHQSSQTSNGSGGLFALVMDGLRVQLKKPAARNGGGGGGSSSSGGGGGLGKKGFGTHLRSPNVHRSAEFTVSLRGWLYRLEGAAPLKQWKRRWCVLTDYVLFYYKDINEEKKLGSVLLPSYRISPCFATTDGISRRHAFKAEHSNMKTYYFAAECKQTAQQWMNALSLASIMQLAALCPQMGLQQMNGSSSKESPKTSSTALAKSSKNNSSAAQTAVPKNASANGGEGQQPNSYHLFQSNHQQPNGNGIGQRAIGLDESSSSVAANFLAYEEAKQQQQQQMMMMYGYQSQSQFQQAQYQAQLAAATQQLTPNSSSTSQLNLYNSIGLPSVAPSTTGGGVSGAFTGEDANAILHAFAPPKPQRLLQQQNQQQQQQQFYEDAMLTYDHLPAMQQQFQQHQQESISSSSALSYNGGGYPPAQQQQLGSYYLQNAATAFDGGYYFGAVAAAAATNEELPSAYLQHRLPPRPHSADFLERDDQEEEEEADQGGFDVECQNAFTIAAAAAKTNANVNSTASILPSRPKSSMARYGPMLNGTPSSSGLQFRRSAQSTVAAAPQILSQTATYSGLLYNNTTSAAGGAVHQMEQPSPMRPPLPSEYHYHRQDNSLLANRTAKRSTEAQMVTNNYLSTTSEEENCLTSSRTTATTEDGLIEMSKEDMYKASKLFFQRQNSSLSSQPVSLSTTDCPSYTNTYTSSSEASLNNGSQGHSIQSVDLNLNRNQQQQQQQLKTTKSRTNVATADWNDVGLPAQPPLPSVLNTLNGSTHSSEHLPTSSSGRVKAAKMAIESAAAAAAATASTISGSSCSSSLLSFQMITSSELNLQKENDGDDGEAEVKFKLSSKVRTYRRPKSGGGGSVTGTSDTSSDIVPVTAVLAEASKPTPLNSAISTTSTTITTTTSSSSSAPYYYSDLLSAEQREQLRRKLDCNFAASPPALLSRASTGSGGSLSAARLLGMTTLQGVKSQQTSLAGAAAKPLPSIPKTLPEAKGKAPSEEKKSSEAVVIQKQEKEEADNECNEKRQQEMMLLQEKEKEKTTQNNVVPKELVTGDEDGEGHIYENYHHHSQSAIPSSLEQHRTEDTLDPGSLNRGGSGSSKHSSSTTASNGRTKRRVKRRSPKEDHHHHHHHHSLNNISDSEISKNTEFSSHRNHYRKGSSGGGKSSKISSKTGSSSYPKKAASMSTLLVDYDRGYGGEGGNLEDGIGDQEKREAATAAISTVRRQLSELQLAAAAELPTVVPLLKTEALNFSSSSTSTKPAPLDHHHHHQLHHPHQDSPTPPPATTNLEHLRRQQTALAGELDRVRGLLTHSTRRLEEKAVENAQMEQEMRLARSKLKQVLASEQEAAELARSSKLAAELAHINAVIDDLHSRRQELNRAIEGLKLCPPTPPTQEQQCVSKTPLSGAYFSQDVGEEEVEDVENSFSSPSSIPLYENISLASNDQVNNNNSSSNGSLLNHHHIHNHLQSNSLEDEEEGEGLEDMENDEFFTLNINLASKQYGGNKFTAAKDGVSTNGASSSLEINNNDSVQHNLNALSGSNSGSSSTMCEFDPTKDMIGHHHHHLSSSHPYGSDGSIIDQQIRQIYNYHQQTASAVQQSSAAMAAKPAQEIRTVREVKREAERRKVVQQQQQLNFHSRFSQLYGVRSGGDLQRSQQQQQNFYQLLTANHYYTPSESTPAEAVAVLEGVQSNPSGNIIVAANGEQFDVLPAYGDHQRAQYTGLPSSESPPSVDQLFFESKTTSSVAAPDIVQSTIKFAAGEVESVGAVPALMSRYYEQ